MKSRSGNEIDALLAKMLQQPDSTYIPNIDRNLDCLYTSLQIEMVNPDVHDKEQEPRQEIDGKPAPKSELLIE